MLGLCSADIIHNSAHLNLVNNLYNMSVLLIRKLRLHNFLQLLYELREKQF